MDMNLKSSSSRTGFSILNQVSDPEEKEVSDDDDDDRNHKHRRRETRSQFLDREAVEQTLTQPYRKRNRPFENGQSGPQPNYNSNRDLSKFDMRRPTVANFSRLCGDLGNGRGRAMLLGRGLPNVLNSPIASWSGFGLIPAIPNGAIDSINPLGLPGILRPQFNPSLNLGFQRQCCRDFEERGFCLRGDMCPMEHGVNRIVVEDVQSLSQFDLPVSLPSAHTMRSSSRSGLVPSVSASPSALTNSRGLNYRTSNSAAEDALNFDEKFSGTVNASGGDVYDPDQPLWNDGGNETSRSLLGLQCPNFNEPEALLVSDLSDRLVRRGGVAVGSQNSSSSSWGRVDDLKQKDKFESTSNPSECPEARSQEVCKAPGRTLGISQFGKKNNGVTIGPKTTGSTFKVQNDIGPSVRKPVQKAQRTLFVNGIPSKDNKKENLLSHFRIFGEVIDIYIPASSERAFVQFSKREEAERALKAPDAVMGSRFIKLWWANRDSLGDDGVSVTPLNVPDASASPNPTAFNKGKDNLQHPASKVLASKFPNRIVTAGSDSKPVTSSSPKVPAPVQKMEGLELLQEELRKKQEMLEQKRNIFRRQLDKLAKQAIGVKSEVPDGQAAKRQKVETSADIANTGNTQSPNAISSRPSLQPEVLVENTMNKNGIVCQRSNPSSPVALDDPPSLKQTLRPVATSRFPFHVNRYKLDNRPKSFIIKAPLPAGLASVAALRNHFSLFGEMPDVEIDELEECSPNVPNDSKAMRNCHARISFTTRHSAERAFMNGKSWKGHNLHFTWVTTSNPCSSRGSGGSSSAHKVALNAEDQSADKTTLTNSHEASGPMESNSSPAKPSNEISCDSSRSCGRADSVVPDDEHSVSEAQSLSIPLEGDEPNNKDSEVPDEIADDDILPDEIYSEKDGECRP